MRVMKAVCLLLLALVVAGVAQNTATSPILQFQNGGSTLATIPAGIVRINTSTGTTGTWSSVTKTFTIEASGGGGGTDNTSTSFTAQTTITWNHNLNSLALVFQCYNSIGDEIYPARINSQLNTAIIDFSISETGICVVNSSGGGGGGGSTGFNALTTGSNTTATMTLGTGSTMQSAGTATLNFGTSGHTRPATTGTLVQIPATCGVGDLFFASNATAGQNIYMCTAANTWTQQLNSGGGDTLVAGTGINISGPSSARIVALASATQRTFLTGGTGLTFTAISAAGAASTSCRDLTIPVSGAAIADAVIPHWPEDLQGGLAGTMFVSAADTVTVRLCNSTNASVTPTGAKTYSATVLKSF